MNSTFASIFRNRETVVQESGRVSKHRKAKAPLPEKLPGKFAVLVTDSTAEDTAIKIFTDDEYRNSYSLGPNPELNPPVAARMALWSPDGTLKRAIALVRTHGIIQWVFETGVLIPVRNRKTYVPIPDWKKHERSTSYTRPDVVRPRL